MSNRGKRQITLRVPADLLDRADALVETMPLPGDLPQSRSNILRMAMEIGIRELEGKERSDG